MFAYPQNSGHFGFVTSSFSPQFVRSTFLQPKETSLTSKGSESNGSFLPVRRSSIVAVVSKGPVRKTNISQATDLITTMDKFWELADESKLNAQYNADDKIAFLKNASAEEVRSICLQYRYFVERYPDHLAGLLRKMPNNKLKSQLAMILAEEMGSGHIEGAHIVWYDNFLKSIGVKEEELTDAFLYLENESILNEIERRCENEPQAHGIGLVGMGGECLCQIYLTAMHKCLVQNGYLKSLGRNVDWIFWNFHIGEEDVAHREMVRKTINETITDPSDVQQLAAGYSYGKKFWDLFWQNNYKGTRISSQS